MHVHTRDWNGHDQALNELFLQDLQILMLLPLRNRGNYIVCFTYSTQHTVEREKLSGILHQNKLKWQAN